MKQPTLRASSAVFAMIAAAMLSGCAAPTQKKVGSAATAPLNDLNIISADIPAVLQEARKHPYKTPTDAQCPALVGEIHQLDDALGADLDAPASKDDPSLLDQGSDLAEDTAIGALQRTTEGLIPFRSWVRKLTGAERHSKAVSAAIRAGVVRRAYLKGVGSTMGCVWLPAPAPAATQAAVASSSKP